MKTGKLPESALKRSVLKQIHRKKNEKCAAVGADCAFFTVPDGQIPVWRTQTAAIRTDADAPRGRIWQSAASVVIKCVNNLAAAGASPACAMVSLMLPEEAQEAQVRELMGEIAAACESAQIEIAGGDTNITSAVTAPVLGITAVGFADIGRKRDLGSACAGHDLVLSKWIGLEGTAALAREKQEVLLARYPAYLVETAQSFNKELSVLPEARLALENGVGAMHDLSQGGIFGALWELAEGCGLGLCVDLKKIPIRQETVEVCEVCNVNPYEMCSAGSLLMTAKDGPALAGALSRANIPAAVIGHLTEGSDRIIRNGEEIRYLDRPTGADVIAQALTNA